VRIFRISGQQVCRYDAHESEHRWVCSCPDFASREKDFGTGFCVHIARVMMQLLLESHGVEVFAAENGVEGTALIERVRPDLALVDLGLPVMSGFEVARRVRQGAAQAKTRLVALSGYGQDSDIQAALDAGFDEHLTKPPDPERLDQLLAGTASSKWAERHQPRQVQS